MIKNQDRKGYFGASDTKHIMRDNHETKTWKQWWSTKLGAPNPFTENRYTRAGNYFEHAILDAIDEGITKDGQIIMEEHLIRVNYDGYKDGVIYEVKTYDANNEWKVRKEYWQQCQVEMFVYKEMAKKWFLPPFKKLVLVSYPLYEEDYQAADRNDPDPIVDPNRLNMEVIEYDEKFIKQYLKRVKKLSKKLRKALKGEGGEDEKV